MKFYIPWPVLMETFCITAREGGDAKALRRYAMVKQLPAQFSDQMNEATLLAAARFKANHTVSISGRTDRCLCCPTGYSASPQRPGV
jgi:hypothetical protein